ncbi:MAG: hypothetical protein WC526_01230 [Patescibacteria group bacterium]
MENQDFIKDFNIGTNGLFLNLTPLKDCKFGFSIIRKMGSDDWGSIFYIYISNENVLKDGNIKPLSIRVSYGKLKEDDKGSYISLSNQDKIKKVTGPIDFTSNDEYFYDVILNKFYKKNKEITANMLLDELYLLHTKPTMPLKGFKLRLKLLFWRVIITDIIKFISDCFQWLLLIISGTKFTDIWSRIMKNDKIYNSPESNNQFGEPEKWDLLGFKAPFWPIAFFCILHFILYIIFWKMDYKPNFIITILKNNFLTLIYTISFLALLDRVLPKTLKFLINKTSNLYLKISLKSIKL